MRIATVAILAAALLTLIPALAAADDNPYFVHAAFVSSVVPAASCDGWSADVTVRFRWAMPHIDASFTLTLSDEFDNVIETITWTDELDRGVDEWPTLMVHYEGDWSAFAPTGDYTVSVVAAIEGAFIDGVDVSEETGTVPFHCQAVGTEAVTLGDIRGMYR